ncbi:MAG: TetR family transcriptional regulator [Oscillospiraceae bacterium]
MMRTQGKRQIQKKETRETILKTAMLLYSLHGFSISTNSIAQAAELSHGSIFVHFPTRDELLIHTLNRFSAELGEKLHNLSLAGEDIQQLLYTHIDILKEYEAFYTHLISEISALPEEANQILISVHSFTSHHFEEVITKSVQAGKIKNIPIHMIFNTWIALLHYYLQNKMLFSPENSVLDRYQDDLVSTFIALIRT